MKMSSYRSLFLLLYVLWGGFASSARADTFVVTNTSNSGNGSLYNAMQSAESTSNTAGPDLITFNIPGTGVHTIHLTSALPNIFDPVIIDGYSQPGSKTNTSSTTDNAVLKIEITADGSSSLNAFSVFAPNCTFKGMILNSLAGGINFNSPNATGNHVEGCFIGTDSSGLRAVPNFYSGIGIFNGSANNVIGGTTPAARNVLSGNAHQGVDILPQGGATPHDNLIAGNFIGTDVTGAKALSNGGAGIYISDAAKNTVGGTATGAGNVISGNLSEGIYISGSKATGNLLQGNFLGANVSGVSIKNGRRGVLIDNGANGNSVTSGNTIAFNTEAGISIYNDDSTGNAIRGNSIYSNGSLADGGSGIKLMTGNQYAQNVPTPNDDLDADDGGPNNGQNWPVITSSSGGILSGTLDSLPNSSFTIDVYGNDGADSSAFGEGRYFLGTVKNVKTDANGQAPWSFTLPAGAKGDGQSFSATATSSKNDTSEFGPSGASGVVTNTQNSGGGSLYNAITIANLVPGTTILFNIPKSDPHYANGIFTITPSIDLPLPSITADNTIIEGSSQQDFTPDANALGPAIVVSGTALPAQNDVRGLMIRASHCVVRDIVVNGFLKSDGIEIVGGTGVALTDNRIEGCYIGTDATGAKAVPNGNGINVFLDGSTAGSAVTGCVIGGTTDAQRNVISGNAGYGVLISNAAVSDIAVSGNYVGVDRTGTTALANGDASVAIGGGAHDNTVGGITSNTRNVIIGVNVGVRIDGAGTDKNLIQGNYIGTDAAAAHTIGIGAGVSIDRGAQNNLIGGTDSGAANIIAGKQAGVSIGAASHNPVQGNFIGTNRSGARLGNQYGIRLNGATLNTIGGTSSSAANIICSSSSAGIDLLDPLCTNNTIQGNQIGIAPDGTTSLPNTVGVTIGYGANHNLLGGTATGAGNVISGNTETGVTIENSGTTANLIQGNFIGTNAANSVLGNGKEGILVQYGPTSNVIGAPSSATGTAVGVAANHIANNGADGISVLHDETIGNTIRGNAISGNSGLGIDLRPSDGMGGGVSANDSDDKDSGPNRLQNFPLIKSITAAGGKTTVMVTLNSTADSSFLLDLYDNSVAEPSGFGEGATYITSQTVKTDSSGNATYDFILNGTTFGGLFTLTATNIATGDTSEFSPQGASAVVTNTLDIGPGSLRNALSIAQILKGTTVRFNIPATDVGLKNGVFTISPRTALPPISKDYTIVDGTTQTTFGGDTNTRGPEIAIDGANLSASSIGLVLESGHCTIQGLAITRFGTGINLSFEPASYNTISACYLGLSADGTVAASNDAGIFLGYGAHDNTIGSIAGIARNVISGNTTVGIHLQDNANGVMARNKIIGNYIGLNPSGTAPVGNGLAGISIDDGATGTTIGGTSAGERNVISGNQGEGILLANTSGHRIVGNFIGTNALGTEAVPNRNGIIVDNGVNTIGGPASGEGNRIAFNRFYGIEVNADPKATDNHITMRGNAIYSNGSLGIDLLGGKESFYGGVTLNDDSASDADSGPNDLQNYPVITGFSAANGQTTIKGTLTSQPNRDYVLDFYRVTRPDDTGYGEGDLYLGKYPVTTDPKGQAGFSFTGNFSGQYFSATATDVLSGDTSEFSSASVTVKITDFSPKIGAVGTIVKITGGSFVGTTTVKFGETKAKYSVSSDGTSITATVPGGARTGQIRVTTPIGVAQTEDEFVVTPPFNDNFANALTIEAFGGGLTGHNNGATKESGEPDHAAPGRTSVWYRWQPAFSGQASVGIPDCDFDTLLAVYTGTKVSALQLVASNNDVGNSKRSAVAFPVTGSKIYYIAVDGADGAEGRFTLQWTLVNKAPDNDNFANAKLIEGDNSRNYGTNLLATRESGEPLHATKEGHTSIWYTWTASQNGLASFSTEGSTIDTLLAVYTGDSLTSLKAIASNDDREPGTSTSQVNFSATRGVTYKIAIDGFNGAQGDIVLTGDLNAQRATLTWTGNGGDGLWSNPANWNPMRTPLPTDTASISKTGAYTVTLDIDANVDGLILGNPTSSAAKPTLLISNRHSLTFNSGSINYGSTLSLAGGTFHDNYGLELQGLFDWTGGTWSGYHTYIGAKAVLDIHGSATKTLDSEAITNLGLIKWRDSGNIAGDNGASILNQRNFEVSTDASLIWDGTGKEPNFLNDRGAFFVKRKATTGTNQIGWIFGNDGKVSVEAGMINLEGGGVSYGDFDITTDARINVAKDYVFDKQTSRFTGGGFAAIISGTTGFDIGVSATNFEFSQGQLEGKDDLSVSKKFVWTGGAMAEGGTTTMIKSSTMEIGGSTSKAIAQRTLVNNGTVNWSEGNIQADNGAKITNNGNFNCVVGTKMTYRSGPKLEFNNAKGANLTGSTTISGNVTNLGHLKPLNTLRLGGGALAAADVNDGGGLINITGDLVQGNGAQIDILINGTLDPQTKKPLYGQIGVGGVVNLTSNCGLTLTAPTYTFKSGDEFKVLYAVSILGDFGAIKYPTLPASLIWSAAKVPENGLMTYVVKVSEKAPVISSFSPTSGVAGASLTIVGQNLSNADATLPVVSCGGIKATVQSATPTQIKALIPPTAKTGEISVTTAAGMAQSSSVLTIRPLITSISPTMGATGQVVLIKGTNLITTSTPKPSVKFNQTVIAASDLVSASATQLKVKIPAAATTGKISVTTSDGTTQSATSFTFLATPLITTVPASGTIGATITIKGKNFVNANTTKPTVKFGSFTAPSDSITSVSAIQLKVVVPIGAKTGKITVQNSGGVALSATSFVIQ